MIAAGVLRTKPWIFSTTPGEISIEPCSLKKMRRTLSWHLYQSFVRIPTILLTLVFGFGIIRLALRRFEC